MKIKRFMIFSAVIGVLVVLGGLAVWRTGAAEAVIDWLYDHTDANGQVDMHDDHGHPAGDDVLHGSAAPEPGHSDHADELVRLTPEQCREMGVILKTAGPGQLHLSVTVPGEVVVNADRVAHVVPRVEGVVRAVHKRLGDMVEAGEVMAILDSRELAAAQAAFLAARERLALAKSILEREQRLWQQKVSAERDYLAAKQAHAEAVIALHSAEQNLHVLGVTDEFLAQLTVESDPAFEPYRLVAPIPGRVIEKHITLGEKLDANATAFTVADLRDVWVHLTVYQKDIGVIEPGLTVEVRTGRGELSATGTIDYVSPIVDATTRTAVARVVLDNPQGRWRPGMFVSGRITLRTAEAPVAVERDALQIVEGQTVVFVRTQEGFEPVPVQTGRQDSKYVEIVAGLRAGQPYAAQGAFVLKAEHDKGSFGSGHVH